jgi:hypothetical protein
VALVSRWTSIWTKTVLGFIDEALLLPVVVCGEVKTLIQVHQLRLGVRRCLAIEASASSDKGESGDADETLLVLESRLLGFVGTDVHLSLILSYQQLQSCYHHLFLVWTIHRCTL